MSKPTKEPRSLKQMALEASEETDGSIACPKCGCKDFRTYRTSRGQSSRFHYKSCRHCGHKILTASKTVERIVRDVVPHADDEDGDSILSLIG